MVVHMWFLENYQIAMFLQNCDNDKDKKVNISFNPISKVWYGWSTRSCDKRQYFGIGSKCKRGDICWTPRSKDDFIFYIVSRYDKDEIKSINTNAELNGQEGVKVTISSSKRNNCSTTLFFTHPKRYGRGEWIARTLDDAKQMAIDFARNAEMPYTVLSVF